MIEEASLREVLAAHLDGASMRLPSCDVAGQQRTYLSALSYFAALLAWSASEVRCQVLSGLNAVMPAAMPAVCGPRSFS
jgi:hypothetical protein